MELHGIKLPEAKVIDDAHMLGSEEDIFKDYYTAGSKSLEFAKILLIEERIIKYV